MNKTGENNMKKKKINPHLRRLKLVKPYIGLVLLGFLMLLITVGTQLTLPRVISYFIDHAATPQDPDWMVMPFVLFFVMLIVYCMTSALRFYLFEYTGSMIVNDLRKQLYDCMIQKEIGFFDMNKSGELTSRLVADIDALKTALNTSIGSVVRALLVGIGSITMILTLSLHLSTIVLFAVPTSTLLAKWLGEKMRKKSKALQESLSQSVHIAQESFSNIRVIHAFNQEKKASKAYATATGTVLENSLGNAKLMATFQGMSTFSTLVFLLIILLVGAIQIAQGTMSMGELTGFVMYAAMVVSSVGSVSSLWGLWMRSYGSTERVFELIDESAESAFHKEGTSKPVQLQGQVEFEGVEFAYPGRKEKTVLHSFNLTIHAGEKVALVGPSGAGKTTVINLLLGFYQPTAGTIKLDGTASHQLDLKDIRDSIAIVEQEPVLFSGTIAENIGYALSNPNDHLDEIRHAASVANAHDFITHFPSGYDTPVGEKGTQLSGGQKQRIAIARAILKNPKILILDEATSALDSESEMLVQDALEKLMYGRTTIMIAHRYSTIVKADKLVVLDQGQLIEYGEHEDLFEDETSLYHKLMRHQLSEGPPV